MSIEKELQEFIKLYSAFDEDKKCYTDKPDKSALLKIDEQFTKWLNKKLLANGPEEEKIKKNYKKLSLYFHPDKSSTFPEVVWLEDNLSEGQNNGMCFKTLHFCYEKLTNPEKFKEVKYADINTRDDFKKWLETLKAEATTYTGRSLYGSLIGLLEQASGYFDEVGQIRPRGIRALVAILPVIFASYGAIIFAEQLFAVYSLYFLVLKGGQYLERSNAIELQILGRALQEISTVTAAATTTLLIRLLEMTFWLSRQCYDMTLQIGSAILTPLLRSPAVPEEVSEEQAARELCKELIVASKNLTQGMRFETPELKLIAAPLEAYLGQSEQLFGSARAGNTKRLKVESFLLKMRFLDNEKELPLDTKLEKAKKELNELKDNKKVYTPGGKTARAVDEADSVITYLSDDPVTTQLVLYNGQI